MKHILPEYDESEKFSDCLGTLNAFKAKKKVKTLKSFMTDTGLDCFVYWSGSSGAPNFLWAQPQAISLLGLYTILLKYDPNTVIDFYRKVWKSEDLFLGRQSIIADQDNPLLSSTLTEGTR